MKIITIVLILFVCLSILLNGCTFNIGVPTATPAVPDNIRIFGGYQLIYQADVSQFTSDNQKSALDSDVKAIKNRLDALGASYVSIYELSNNKILVYCSGITDIDKTKILVGDTSILEFGELTTDADPNAKWTSGPQKWKPAMGNLNGQQVALNSGYFKNNVSITADPNGNLLVLFEWDSDGSVLSKKITTRLYNDNHAQLAIFSGDKLISAPSVNGIIIDKGQIDGLSKAEATELRDLLNSGRLQVPLTLTSFQSIAPAK